MKTRQSYLMKQKNEVLERVIVASFFNLLGIAFVCVNYLHESAHYWADALSGIPSIQWEAVTISLYKTWFTQAAPYLLMGLCLTIALVIYSPTFRNNKGIWLLWFVLIIIIVFIGVQNEIDNNLLISLIWLYIGGFI